jgi:hypothetical protein
MRRAAVMARQSSQDTSNVGRHELVELAAVVVGLG